MKAYNRPDGGRARTLPFRPIGGQQRPRRPPGAEDDLVARPQRGR